ncbi:MAG TPA: hypothetical protein VGM73_07185 [Candidatus Didemnitutus sp.]
MKIVLERCGGFTGPAGRDRIELDLSQVSVEQFNSLSQEIDAIPGSAWNGKFLSPHPKPWDFRHVLRVGEGAAARSVEFHLDQGPPVLTRLAAKIVEAGAGAAS